ncbi:MAG: VOC family protein [Pseudomonadota bacterium]
MALDLRTSGVSVFLATANPAEATRFYRDVLGLEFVEDSPFAVVFKLAGAELRLSKVPSFQPFPWTVVDWRVDDIDAALAGLAAAGVDLERFDGMDQDERGVWTVPGGGAQIAWFMDPDGNVLSVSQRT